MRNQSEQSDIQLPPKVCASRVLEHGSVSYSTLAPIHKFLGPVSGNIQKRRALMRRFPSLQSVQSGLAQLVAVPREATIETRDDPVGSYSMY